MMAEEWIFFYKDDQVWVTPMHISEEAIREHASDNPDVLYFFAKAKDVML